MPKLFVKYDQFANNQFAGEFANENDARRQATAIAQQSSVNVVYLDDQPIWQRPFRFAVRVGREGERPSYYQTFETFGQAMLKAADMHGAHDFVQVLENDQVRHTLQRKYDLFPFKVEIGQELVQFSLNRYAFGNLSYPAVHNILARSLGMYEYESNRIWYQNNGDVFVHARPEQFARFIIERYKAGINVNGIKNLVPQLITASFQRGRIDVSGR